MPGVLLDTDVVSFLSKPNTPQASLYQPHIQGVIAGISFQTLAELLRWPLERNWGATRRMQREQHLQQYAIQPWDWDLCRTWAVVRADCKRAGHSIDSADAWHAATALYLGVPLLTHNRRHFAGVPGLQLISHAP